METLGLLAVVAIAATSTHLPPLAYSSAFVRSVESPIFLDFAIPTGAQPGEVVRDRFRRRIPFETPPPPVATRIEPSPSSSLKR